MWPFNHNKRQMYEQYADSWDQGTYSQLPDQDVQDNYYQFMQNAPPQVVEQVHERYFEHMPREERGNLLQNLMGGLMQQGVDPRQVGIQNVDPYSMSPNEAARLVGYTRQQNPDLLQQIMGPGGPLGSIGAKIIVAGIVALAAKHLLGSHGQQF